MIKIKENILEFTYIHQPHFERKLLKKFGKFVEKNDMDVYFEKVGEKTNNAKKNGKYNIYYSYMNFLMNFDDFKNYYELNNKKYFVIIGDIRYIRKSAKVNGKTIKNITTKNQYEFLICLADRNKTILPSIKLKRIKKEQQ